MTQTPGLALAAKVHALHAHVRSARQQMGAPPENQIDERCDRLLDLLERSIEELFDATEDVHDQLQRLGSEHDAFRVEASRERRLFELAPVAYVVTGPDGRVREANVASYRLLQRTAAALVDKPIFTLLASADRTPMRTALEGHRNAGNPEPLEMSVHLLRGGTAQPASVTVAAARDDSGDVTEILWLFRDAHATPPQTKDLVSAKRSAQLLGIASHEMRNPLSSLLGAAAILSETELDAEQREVFGVIERSGRTLLELIEQMLDSARIELGESELESIPFDPRDLLEDLARDLSCRVAADAVDLVCRIDPSLPALLIGDPVRIRQVLANIAGNAVKFTESGEIEIRAASARTAIGVLVTVTVSDTGPGIEADRLPLIFDPFAPGGMTRRRHGGHGLGLSIAKRIIERMGGSIGVESEVRRGTTFTVRLALPIATDSKAAERDLAKARVLLVDDRDRSSESFASTLGDLGAVVTRLQDGGEAIRMIEDRRDFYDAILIDVRLKKTKCFDILERFRGDRTILARTFVILPLRHRVEDPRRLQEFGVAGSVSTPVKASELSRALRSVLAQP